MLCKIIKPLSRSRRGLKTTPFRDTSTPPGAQNLAQKPPESQNPAQKPPRAQNPAQKPPENQNPRSETTREVRIQSRSGQKHRIQPRSRNLTTAGKKYTPDPSRGQNQQKTHYYSRRGAKNPNCASHRGKTTHSGGQKTV